MNIPPQTRKKLIAFRLVVFLLPIFFFGVLELTLRYAEYGGDLGLFHDTIVNGKTYYVVNPDVTKRYFRTIQVRAIASNQLFEKVKRPNTYRIFCLGESSTLGYPYMYNGSFPSMLKERLESAWPDKNIEVVNLGITAVSSYTVADFTNEVMSYQPDALLVYCGHNEFYGALGVGSTEGLGKSRRIIKAYLALEQWRTFRLIRDGINSVKEMLSSNKSQGREATVMEGMVKNREIEYGSDDYTTAVKNFRANLEEIAETASTNKVRLVLGTLVSNLGGMEPFISMHSTPLDQPGREEWENLYRSALEHFRSRQWSESESAIRQALQRDSLPANGHFLLGRVYEQAGRFVDAENEYSVARDFDGLRFRAPSDFNGVVREVAARHGIPLADGEKLIAGKSKNGIIGNEFLLEHVHLNVDGYFWLAKAFYEAMSDGGCIAPKAQWYQKPNKSDAEYRSEVSVTPLDSVMASIRLYVLMNSWPFRDSGISVQQFDAKTDMERLAKSCLLREVTWEQAHVKAAEQYEAQGNLRAAAEEYRDLAKATPTNASPLLRLGQIYLNIGDDRRAEVAFAKALQDGENYFAYQGIGFARLRRNDFEGASEHFRKSLQLARGIAPDAIVELQQMLAVALAGSGKFDEAEKIAQSIVSLHPEMAQARQLLGRIQLEKNKTKAKIP